MQIYENELPRSQHGQSLPGVRLEHALRALLNSEEGIQRRKKRCFDLASIFGNIKQNHRFKRFLLRGKEKVKIE